MRNSCSRRALHELVAIDRNVGKRQESARPCRPVTWLTFPPTISRARVSTPRPVSTPHRVVFGKPVIEGVLGDATHAVPAHLGFAAVGVEHAHPHVGLVAGQMRISPSPPIPKCRSDTFAAVRGVGDRSAQIR